MPAAEILAPVSGRPPMPGPLLVLPNGMVLLQQPDGSHAPTPLEQGLTMGWMDLGAHGILLSIRDAHCCAAGIATTLSRIGLKGLIADLQSIDAQLDALP